MTNDEQAYHYAETYSDHGHDHIGANRGMEKHPILGFNYRISELNAAVGVAQSRKVPYILERNRHNKTFLTNALKGLPGISFASLPDASGDSATFLNLLLPDTLFAQRLVNNLNNHGIGGFNYWFLNQYHFINQWDHLKELRSASKLPIHLLGSTQNYSKLDLPVSQSVIGRLISFGIRCTWNEQELTDLASKISTCYTLAIETKQYA